MTRLIAICILAALLPFAAVADNDEIRDRIIVELTEDGFEEIRVSKTLLGRMRFVATKPRYRREIVVNPVTGVILRDYLRIVNGSAGSGSGASGSSGSSGSSGGGSPGGGYDDDDYDDDDDDDDDDDREDREDRSGSNSGSDRDDD